MGLPFSAGMCWMVLQLRAGLEPHSAPPRQGRPAALQLERRQARKGAAPAKARGGWRRLAGEDGQLLEPVDPWLRLLRAMLAQGTNVISRRRQIVGAEQ